MSSHTFLAHGTQWLALIGSDKQLHLMDWEGLNGVCTWGGAVGEAGPE